MLKRLFLCLSLLVVTLLVCGVSCVSWFCGGVGEYDSPRPADSLPSLAAPLRKHVTYLAVDCYPRSIMYPDNQKKAVKYIEREFKKAGAKVSRQKVLVAGREFENVVATIPGESEEVLVIGAHYDSYGETPGADDNASGVAGIIELCRQLAGSKTYYTLEIVAYCNEEPPYFRSEHMGSVHHAEALKSEDRKVAGMICLEMIGYFSEEEGSQEYPVGFLKNIFPTKGNFLAVVGNMSSSRMTKEIKKSMERTSSLPVVYLVSPNISGLTLDFSDHRSYWAAGFPGVMITDTAFYRNFNYHEAEDTPDSLDYEKMSLGIHALHQAILDWDGKGREKSQ